MPEYLVSVGNDQLDLDEVIEFVSRVFGPNYYEASIIQRQIIENEPSRSPENFVIAHSHDGELIGVVRIVQRNMLLGGVELRVGGISSVGVRPDWRRRGVASELMSRALEAITSRGMDLSILYGRRAVDGFYSRFGYFGIGRYIDLQLLSYPESEISLRAVPFERGKQELCMKLYEESYHGLSGSVARDTRVWDFLIMRIEKGIGAMRGLMIVKRGTVIGYLVSASQQLIEIALPQQFFPGVQILLRGLDVRSISIHPRHPYSIYSRTRMNTIQEERFALDGGYMGRILNPGSLLEKLVPTLGARAKILRISDQRVRLFNYEIDLGGGRISKTSEKDDIIFEKPERAVQFLLGVIRPHDVVGIYWTREKPWVPYLFPELYFHTSAWDEI